MNVTNKIATIQVYIKQVTNEDVGISPHIQGKDMGKLMHMYNIAKKWLKQNVI